MMFVKSFLWLSVVAVTVPQAQAQSPTSSPTTKPSSQPSEMPSDVPSSEPSDQPSSEPSDQPSESPSLKPSQSPSSEPSDQPSESPSLKPSQSPSESPSLKPSQSPSLKPSTSPSEQPSSMPSESPSGQPSSEPSSQPSCTPSSAPTPFATTYLYYPDWSVDGCLNDGNQPAYMSSNPSDHLYTTVDACCVAHFGWNFNACSGNLPGACARALYYPDWAGENKGCLNDGNEPEYMTTNPTTYLFSQLADCCDANYAWSDECKGASSSPNADLFYPDWLSTGGYCKNGGGQPKYMNNSPSTWMHATKAECCSANFGYDLDNCNGVTPSTTPGTVEKYYPDWENNVCKNDGKEPAYMTANPTQYLYDTAELCCGARFGWNDVCVGSPSGANASKFYMDYAKGYCVQNCDGALPCGSIADSWEELYDTLKACCASKDWWNDDCESQQS